MEEVHCVKSVQIQCFLWSVFSRIRIEYGEILRISPYSVWMRENTDQKKLRIWTLHVVVSKVGHKNLQKNFRSSRNFLGVEV